MWRAARGAACAQQRLRLARHLHGGGDASVATGPGLAHFLPPAAAAAVGPAQWLEGRDAAAGAADAPAARPLRVFLESYGCQMNSNDAEVVLSVLADSGYTRTQEEASADVILVNTCAIRDKAEQRVWQRLAYFRALKYSTPAAKRAVVGVLGCMAERLKAKLLEADRLADIVAGPDAYRDLPRLIEAVRSDAGSKAMNVQLSADETYADIVPVRPAGAKSAFITIMRGCNNMCAFCIVPFTRGRERSRPVASVVDEVRALSRQGVKEVTLLGQNVNSFADFSERDAARAEGGEASPSGKSGDASVYAPGFRSVYVPRRDGAVSFAELLQRVADVDPEMRIRFTSPHPKDFPDEVLRVIASRPNVCACLHMPAQSGSDTTLARMGRGYTRDAYLALVARARELIPGVEFTSDFISGFCGETEAEHADTVSLVREMGYSQAFMFAYSRREKTAAARHQADDVPEAVKQRRLAEVIQTFREVAMARNVAEVGRVHCVLVEGASKKNDAELAGRTDTGKTLVFPDHPLPLYGADDAGGGEPQRAAPGDYVAVVVERGTTGTLMGRALGRTTLQGFHARHGAQHAWLASEQSAARAAA